MTEASKRVTIRSEASDRPATMTEWRPLETMRRDLDHLIDDLMRSLRRMPFDILGTAVSPLTSGSALWQLAPASDVLNKPTHYEITAELPGMDEKDVEVKLTDGMLVIKGEKKQHKAEKGDGYCLSERRFGSIERAFRLPPGADTRQIEAVLKNGVLTVTVPKTTEAISEKKISIQAA